MVELNKTADKNSCVFTGDSITHWYPMDELIRGVTVHNRGNAGYFTYELLDTFDEIVLCLKPDKIFILIGTNDMSIKSITPKDACDNTERMIEKIKKALPETEIHLLSVYPVNVSKHQKVLKKICKMRHYYPEKIVRLNELYHQLTKKHHIRYVDLYNGLCDENGQLKIEYTIDGLHLSTEGYRHVTECLKEYIL